MNSSANSRGTKRQLDVGQSPQKKRYRSEGDLEEEEDNDGDHDDPDHDQAVDRGLAIDHYAPVTDAVWKYFDQKQQSSEVYGRKMRLKDALYTVMKGVFPYCGLYVVGSSMNGFGSDTSDMDLCLMLSQTEIEQKKEATEILRGLFKALHRCTFIRDLKLIKAKVPILKFFDRISGVECDLNINNYVGIRNTHLLNAYSKLDWRLAPLVLFVKYWARAQNINDAKEGTISSYSLGLMIIHYLQHGCTPPVLPSLQQKYPHKFNPSLDIRLLSLNEKLPDYKSPNTQSLGELFVGFLEYYANIFDFEEDAITVRLGKKVARQVVMRQSPQKNAPGQWKFICIEEPFDLSNTARSVYDPYVFQRIYGVFRRSWGKLHRTMDVHTILDEPL